MDVSIKCVREDYHRSYNSCLKMTQKQEGVKNMILNRVPMVSSPSSQLFHYVLFYTQPPKYLLKIMVHLYRTQVHGEVAFMSFFQNPLPKILTTQNAYPFLILPYPVHSLGKLLQLPFFDQILRFSKTPHTLLGLEQFDL